MSHALGKRGALVVSSVICASWLFGCAKGSATSATEGAGGSATVASSSSSGSGGMRGAGGAGGMMGVGGAGGSGGAPLLPLGADCLLDEECDSHLCKAVLLDTDQHVCVTPCVAQTDCGAGGDFFCDPKTPGETSGYCVPRSPAHCLACTTDAACGSLSEACFLAPGDSASACHVDCSIAGDAACPPDYACTDQMVNGVARKLCRPNVPSCLDAVGGYCDRVSMAQPCVREGASGTCSGTRDCQSATGRFDACNAATPQCKPLCTDQDPAGCMLDFCPDATTGPDNCGTCGNVCPGLGAPSAIVSCDNASCTFRCQGEHYDVDQQTSNGCEAVDNPVDNHTQAKAIDKGSFTCFDNISDPAIVGVMISDTREHINPSIDSFSAVRGAAPDWYHVFGAGGLGCTNDIALTLQVTGSSAPQCYELKVITSGYTYVKATDLSGTATITAGSGAYGTGTDLWIVIDKKCVTSVVERVDYTVTGHL